jgi:Mrp family chromosome partitioning ATPase
MYDLVLVDSPPLLAFSDAMTLSARVDAVVAVVRMRMLQRPLLHELGRQLANLRAPVLGVVLTDVEQSESYRYVYEAYEYGTLPQTKGSEKAKQTGRPKP